MVRSGGVSAPEKHQALWAEARPPQLLKVESSQAVPRGCSCLAGAPGGHLGPQACLLPAHGPSAGPSGSTRISSVLQQAQDPASGARERAKERQRLGTQTTPLTLHSISSRHLNLRTSLVGPFPGKQQTGIPIPASPPSCPGPCSPCTVGSRAPMSQPAASRSRHLEYALAPPRPTHHGGCSRSSTWLGDGMERAWPPPHGGGPGSCSPAVGGRGNEAWCPHCADS